MKKILALVLAVLMLTSVAFAASVWVPAQGADSENEDTCIRAIPGWGYALDNALFAALWNDSTVEDDAFDADKHVTSKYFEVYTKYADGKEYVAEESFKDGQYVYDIVDDDDMIEDGKADILFDTITIRTKKVTGNVQLKKNELVLKCVKVTEDDNYVYEMKVQKITIGASPVYKVTEYNEDGTAKEGTGIDPAYNDGSLGALIDNLTETTYIGAWDVGHPVNWLTGYVNGDPADDAVDSYEVTVGIEAGADQWYLKQMYSGDYRVDGYGYEYDTTDKLTPYFGIWDDRDFSVKSATFYLPIEEAFSVSADDVAGSVEAETVVRRGDAVKVKYIDFDNDEDYEDLNDTIEDMIDETEATAFWFGYETSTLKRNLDITMYFDDEAFIYEVDPETGALSNSEFKLDEDDNWVLSTKTPGIYLVSDVELAVEEDAGDNSNPDTGANDVIGVASALAVVAVISAAAVSLKK